MTRVRFREGCPDSITGRLTDRSGAAVDGQYVTACAFTLWDLETGEPAASPAVGIINGRNASDVLGSQEIAIAADGTFELFLEEADNAIVTPRRQIERHRAKLHFEWDPPSPASPGQTDYELEIEVENIGG